MKIIVLFGLLHPTECGFKFWTRHDFIQEGPVMVKSAVKVDTFLEIYNFHNSKYVHGFPVALASQG